MRSIAADRRNPRARLVLATGLLALAILAVQLLASPRPTAAEEATSAAQALTIDQAVDRSCFERQLGSAPGAAATTVAGPAVDDSARVGFVEARVAGPAGSDWDVAVFDASGAVIAAGSSSAATEVASGFVTDPGELTVQACRISGEGEVGELAVDVNAIDTTEVEKASLVMVETPTRRDKEVLQGLGLDLTEHGSEDHVAVVLRGEDDAARLGHAGLDYEVAVPNLARQSARQQEADAAYAAETRRSTLPSGRDTYRRLADYNQELKDLAKNHPELVRPITLNHETYEGRTVEGIEITTDPNNIRDGKPVFLQMGVHHAREWPSGEHAMEWAYELINGFEAGDERVRRLVRQTRTIVIPVINPDGFNASREAGQAQGAANGRDGSFVQNVATAGPNEYRRKNCRFLDDSEGGSCAQPAFGVASPGVDPNRNYGAFWGGGGSSDDPTAEDYRGPGPFSEPETQNVRELVSARHVVTLITNHTFSNLVLRPPGLAAAPDPVDAPLFKELGDAMAAENGYLSQKGFELYDTDGTTEDWSYNATGGLGFTFEIYCNHEPDVLDDRCSGSFHPTFPKVVAEYEAGPGSDGEAVGGGGNREAYFIAQESTANTERHSLLEGEAPPGAILKLEKSVQLPTQAEDPEFIDDELKTEMRVPQDGKFDWHINPSTSPLAAATTGRVADGPPSGPITFSGAPDPVSNRPCGSATTTNDTCFTDHPFEIQNGPGIDNDIASVRIEWPSPASDWDMYVIEDVNGDGSSVVPDGPDEGDAPDSEPVLASSASGPTTSEATSFIRPEGPDGKLKPGDYIVRVVNFAAVEPYSGEISFEGPDEFVPARTEAWSFSCTFAGEERVTQEITIARGERQELDLRQCATGSGRAAKSRCQGQNAELVGSKQDDKIVGTRKRDVIVALGGKDKIRGRGGNDVICTKGGKDKVSGGNGNDKIKVGGGRDKARGAGGNDKVNGGFGKDKLWGNGGKDKIRGGPGKDKIRGGGGKDRCQIKGTEAPRSCEKT